MNHSNKSRELHAVLEAANNAARVTRFADATGCARDEITGANGCVDPFKVLGAMRARGYEVGEPRIPKTQTKPGFTAWKVAIAINGVATQIVFFIPGVAQ